MSIDHDSSETTKDAARAAATAPVRLPDDVRELLREALRDEPYDPAGSSEYVARLRRLAYLKLPPELLLRFERQRAGVEPSACVVIENLPIDGQITGSPASSETGRSFKDGVLSENLIVMFGSLVGEPYSMAHEGPELVNNLTPQHETRLEYTGLGSEVELDFHIENAALRFLGEDDCSPLAILLLGIRYDPVAPRTSVADVREALPLLDAADVEVLYGQHYVIKLPYRWRSTFAGASDHTPLVPVLSGPRHLPRVSCAFYKEMVLPVNERASCALERLHAAVKRVSVRLDVRPGMLVCVDNRFALHARDPFGATYDAGGRPYRWLQRLFVAGDLWRFRRFASAGNRIIHPTPAS